MENENHKPKVKIKYIDTFFEKIWLNIAKSNLMNNHLKDVIYLFTHRAMLTKEIM